METSLSTKWHPSGKFENQISQLEGNSQNFKGITHVVIENTIIILRVQSSLIQMLLILDADQIRRTLRSILI